jgi:hypothetical protein
VDRQTEALQLADELLADIELARLAVDRVVMKATRLARLIEDDVALNWLTFELTGCPDTEAGRRHMARTLRWTEAAEKKGHWGSAAALQAGIDTHRQTIQSFQIGSISGDALVPALREQRSNILTLSVNLGSFERILAQVVAMVHEFVSRVYQELQFSDAQAAMFEAARKDVDARLAHLGGDALTKIASINDRFRAGDSEAISHAMTTARRLIDSVADSVFKARSEPYAIGDESFAVDESRVLNRINAFLHLKGVTAGRRQRLRRTLGDIYGRVSKGVHDDVDIEEARFVFLQTYVVLGEVVSLVQDSDIEP